MTKKSILVTGGAGYVGSHTVLELAKQQHRITVIDNLCNGHCEAIKRIEKLTNQTISLVKGDIRNSDFLNHFFSHHKIDAVFHFAGLKAVGESTRRPDLYYDNNVIGSLALLKAMYKAKVFSLLFSSSSTVYGHAETIPLTEDLPFGKPLSPYGASKQMVEQILQDFAKADSRWRFAALRYFNPIGACPSGQIGESPNSTPENLLPYINRVAVGKLAKLSVFGNDYPSKDGTCIRDYIHVVDVAQGHLAALDYIDRHHGYHAWNLGTGKGYSVLEIITAFEQISKRSIPYQIAPRRAGDVPISWSNPEKARRELGWQAQHSLNQMLTDAWHWQTNNPNGYG